MATPKGIQTLAGGDDYDLVVDVNAALTSIDALLDTAGSQTIATQAALNLTTATSGYVRRVTTIPGAIFVANGTSWIMYGTPVFTNSAGRDAAITAPVS